MTINLLKWCNYVQDADRICPHISIPRLINKFKQIFIRGTESSNQGPHLFQWTYNFWPLSTINLIKKTVQCSETIQAHLWSKMQICRVVACSGVGTCCTGKMWVDDFFTVRVQIHKHPEDEFTSCNCVPLGSYKQRSNKQLQQTNKAVIL